MSQQPQQPSDKDTDPFRPPTVPCEVQCIHCGQTFESWQIEWRELPDASPLSGTWCCPTPGCDGIGFGFDIMPTDPDWTDETGRRFFSGDDEEEEESFEDDDALSIDLDDDDADLPQDVFGEDAIWLDSSKSRPKQHGNTPQAPFKHGHPPFNDDDIPF